MNERYLFASNRRFGIATGIPNPCPDVLDLKISGGTRSLHQPLIDNELVYIKSEIQVTLLGRHAFTHGILECIGLIVEVFPIFS